MNPLNTMELHFNKLMMMANELDVIDVRVLDVIDVRVLDVVKVMVLMISLL
jgi:hypothetical protein